MGSTCLSCPPLLGFWASVFLVHPELLNCSSELLLLPSLSVSPPGVWAPWGHALLFTAVYTQTGSICAMDECNVNLRTTAPRALYVMCFPGGSDSKEATCSAGDPGSIPGLGGSPGEGNGYPLQYSFLENSVDTGAWWTIVHGVAKQSDTTELLGSVNQGKDIKSRNTVSCVYWPHLSLCSPIHH